MATALMWLFIGSAVTLAIKEFQKLRRQANMAKQAAETKATGDYNINIAECVRSAYRRGREK